MTLEITPGQSPYQYRQNAGDPRIVERRLNVHNGRWLLWWMYDTPEEARAALLALRDEQSDAKENTGDTGD